MTGKQTEQPKLQNNFNIVNLEELNKQRIIELKKLIDNANYYYYTLDKPVIEDSLYDSLYNSV